MSHLPAPSQNQTYCCHFVSPHPLGQHSRLGTTLQVSRARAATCTGFSGYPHQCVRGFCKRRAGPVCRAGGRSWKPLALA